MSHDSMCRMLALGLLAAAFILGCSNTPDQSAQAPAPTASHSNITAAPPEQPPTIVHMNLDSQGRALRGYDPVAYFQNSAAMQGDKRFSVSWNEAEWWFQNAENRARFVEEPAKYAPATGGFCTFGVVLSKKFDGDPNVWSISDGQLFVFLNQEVKEKFFQDGPGNVKKVQANWLTIKDKSPEALGS